MKNSLLEIAIKAVKDSGTALLESINQEHDLVWGEKTFKGYKEIKSQADLISEKIIINSIKNDFPDHAILSEESGLHSSESGSEFTWIIDPLHDTVAYVRGNQPEFSITIAVAKGNQVICSVIYQPILGKLYYAEKDKGSFLNTEKISVSSLDDINQANLSIQHNIFKYGEYKKAIPLIKKVKRMYALGSAMLPELASGKVDIVISCKQALYDYAATKLLVEEAGGKVTQDNGGDLPIFFDNQRRFNIVATNVYFHNEIISCLL